MKEKIIIIDQSKDDLEIWKHLNNYDLYIFKSIVPALELITSQTKKILLIINHNNKLLDYCLTYNIHRMNPIILFTEDITFKNRYIKYRNLYFFTPPFYIKTIRNLINVILNQGIPNEQAP